MAEIVSEHGADILPENRPGVPMEVLPPHKAPGAHWDEPEKQVLRTKVFKRVGLEKMTPVFGTAQPPRGLSGWMKARAYRLPETDSRHWALLLASDRMDSLEGRLADL